MGQVMSDDLIKAKKAQVCGLMGMPADESAKLIYSWEAVPLTTSHPIERCYVRIPDEQVARVADRIAELEAEVAQLKAEDEWATSPPREAGYYWIRQVDRRLTDNPKVVFIGKWLYDRGHAFDLSKFVGGWEFRKAR